MAASDSEKSQEGERRGTGEDPVEGAAVPVEGAVVANGDARGAEVPAETAQDEEAAGGEQASETGEAGEKTAAMTKPKQEEGAAEPNEPARPSYTLHVRGLPADVDMAEFEMRLARFGEVVSLQQEEGLVVAKFSRTNDAYKAREKLNGAGFNESTLQVEFGPQDAEHYNRGKKRGMQGKAGVRGDPDGQKGGGRANKTSKQGGMRAWHETGSEAGGTVAKGEDDVAATGKKKNAGNEAATAEVKARPAAFGLTPPTKPVSKWSTDLSFEQQLEDFMRMPRRGMYNRYLVLGKLPPELRTGEAIWRMMHPVQRDIMQIEMITCFNKPVAHIALRSATAAAAMHRLCEQMHQSLTVAFAPPRRASATLWLGNVDDFVPRKELEALLGEFGKVINGLRYLPARTCAFASFNDLNDAIAARNTLYGLEVQRNQYLNVDFVDEGDQGYAADGWGAWGAAPPWAQPWGPQWARPWGAQQQQQQQGNWREQRGRGEHTWQRDGRAGVGPQARSPMRLQERSKRDHRHRSRTRSRGRHSDREASEPQEKPRKKQRRAAAESPPPRKTKQQAAHSDSEEAPAPATKAEGKKAKAKVKLYKMGEFCCNIVANYVQGKEVPEHLTPKLHIDQRTKIDHCKSHMERAGPLATIWHFSAADRKDCAAYDALCDYFVEKQRVGLVQTPSYYVYVVPPTDAYFKALGLPTSNFVVGLQIPIKK